MLPLLVWGAVFHLSFRTNPVWNKGLLILKLCATERNYISLDVVQRTVTVVVQIDKAIVLLRACSVKLR